MSKSWRKYPGLMVIVMGMASPAWCGEPAPVLDFLAADVVRRMVPSSSQVAVTAGQDASSRWMDIAVQAGPEGYPGVALKPDAAWNLSAYGHVQARVINTGSKPVLVALRVDNDVKRGGNPWNTEQDYLKAGATGTVTVTFGYAYGHKPGYALDPSAVTQILLFTGKSDGSRTFRVLSLEAGGKTGEKPPVDPRNVRIKPAGGVLLGPSVSPDNAIAVEGFGGGQGSVQGGHEIRVVLPDGKAEASVVVKPSVGRWDLREASRAIVTVRNDGQVPVTPRILLSSNGETTDPASPMQPLTPGSTVDIAVPFESAIPWRGVPDSGNRTSWKGEKGTGSSFVSDAVSALKMSAKREGEAVLMVTGVRVEAPPAIVPEWLGKRPPVDGDWSMTLQEEFDGVTLNTSKWANSGPNYWDRKSHWSSNNVIVGAGVARIRYEKKTGFQNDDPGQTITLAKTNQSAYASGILETFGKWRQRYGYFEARMKLPDAPGLWPAFWLMPDRGEAVKPDWKRTDTANGGMEFDIMEHLTRWGVQRYNIAMHWDGYGKQHKMTGSTVNYVAPDKDGYITSGLLWEPGRVVFYGNGREIARWDCPRISSVPSYILFTLPCGGWDNDAIDEARLPADFVIDYVRVWQRKDLEGEQGTRAAK